MPFSVREGINIFLSGFIPTENMRFREYGLSFRVYILIFFKNLIYIYIFSIVIIFFLKYKHNIGS
jgi:hypothetical protein